MFSFINISVVYGLSIFLCDIKYDCKNIVKIMCSFFHVVLLNHPSNYYLHKQLKHCEWRKKVRLCDAYIFYRL